ncbi:DNA polymerase epsilon subunit B2 [Klebsormidium nitens]|uniref:DNA polymerase epsilon subunit n=1 Tax=Klebsormidium nitens TaxID=105231 RepID=A0A1Y1HRD7_KLENI|nr:DNA polymerase epsilon subunit B2 [Klebsormidium nitens]|eukprot:GAQ80362.1 DNA polymerase epsilon subunit B2 [Klebsormidium nitens]
MGPIDMAACRRVQKEFKSRGLGLKMDAVKAVADFVVNSMHEEHEILQEIFAELDRKTLSSSILSKEVIDEVLSTLATGGDSGEDAFTFVEAFQMPKFDYDQVRKAFHQSTAKLSIHADAKSKTALYRDRFTLLQQRVLRQEAFTKPALGLKRAEDTQTAELTPLQSLVGSTGTKYVLGFISQLEDGRFFLEDSTTQILLDLSQVTKENVTTGLFTENSFVVVEGQVLPTGELQVSNMGCPPVEDRETTYRLTGGLDFFGAGVIPLEKYESLREQEEAATEHSFMFFSDLHLDDDETFRRLESTLATCQESNFVPSLFVLIGNFWSRPCNLANHDYAHMRAQFKKLATTIAAFADVRDATQFVFVPGPGDPGPANVVPRPPLPKFFTNEISSLLPNAVFASNPCRIRFYTQEIVIFREDLLHKMRRACVVPPSEKETTDPFQQLAVTVLQQSHLCPLPLQVQPIFWEYDHALRLYPLPDVLVLADRAEQKEFVYENVVCFNPGSFANDSSFVIYRPAPREVELNSL